MPPCATTGDAGPVHSARVIQIVLGAVLAAIVLTFVLLPILVPRTGGGAAGRPAPGADHRGTRAVPGASAIDVLREIEFDRATGKLSESDYATLKTEYTGQALEEIRAAGERPGVAASQTRAPTAAAPVCPICGPRPEADALYCSSCARYLGGVCDACGRAVTRADARFCERCGQPLGGAVGATMRTRRVAAG